MVACGTRCVSVTTEDFVIKQQVTQLHFIFTVQVKILISQRRWQLRIGLHGWDLGCTGIDDFNDVLQQLLKIIVL